MRNSHVPEPLRSVLNSITENYRAAHEELRETMAILKPAGAPATESVKIVIEKSPWPNPTPPYLWWAYYEGHEEELSKSGSTPEEALGRFLNALVEEMP